MPHKSILLASGRKVGSQPCFSWVTSLFFLSGLTQVQRSRNREEPFVFNLCANTALLSGAQSSGIGQAVRDVLVQCIAGGLLCDSLFYSID